MINNFNLSLLSSLDLAGVNLSIGQSPFTFINDNGTAFLFLHFLAPKFSNSLGYIDVRSTYQISTLQWQYWLLTKVFKPFLLNFDLWLNFDSSI